METGDKVKVINAGATHTSYEYFFRDVLKIDIPENWQRGFPATENGVFKIMGYGIDVWEQEIYLIESEDKSRSFLIGKYGIEKIEPELKLIPGKKYYVWSENKPEKFTKDNEVIFIYKKQNIFYCVHQLHESSYLRNEDIKIVPWQNIAEIPEDKFAEEKKAFAEGKQIQYWDTCFKKWISVQGEPTWGEINKYRIKPEPKFRAFIEDDPNWKDYFRDIWVKHKKSGYEFKIDGLALDSIYIAGVNYSFQKAFEEFENLDGSPLGVEE